MKDDEGLVPASVVSMPLNPPSSTRTWLLVLFLLALTTAAYAPGLSGGFVFDDFPNIVSNPRIHAESLDLETFRRAAAAYQPGYYGRPLATIGFAVDHLIGGKDPLAYKIHGLLLHLLNAWLVFLLATRLLARAAPAGGTAWPAWAPLGLALLWAIHPLQVSTVLYVVQRMEILCTTFILLALLGYWRGRRLQIEHGRGWAWIVASAFLAGLGMLAKESAILFPLFALALELTLLQFSARSARDERLLRWAYSVFVVASLLVFFLVLLPQYAAPGAYASRDFTLAERLLTQLRVLPLYLGQILLPLPSGMPFYYDHYPKSTGLLEPATTLAGGILIGALLAAAWRFRKSMPLFSLGILLFFAAHALTSNVIRLELVFEHRNYFALFGVLLAVADLLRRIPIDLTSPIRGLVIGSLVLGAMALTLVRSANWGEPLHLASYLADINPASPRASSELATIYAGMSDHNPNSPFFRIAMLEFERGSKLPGSSPLPEQGLILMSVAGGLPIEPRWWDSMEEKLRTRPISPQESMAVTGMLQQRIKGLDVPDDRLVRVMDILLERRPGNAALHSLYAHYQLTILHDEQRAGMLFARAVELSPKDPEYRRRLVEALRSDGFDQAADIVERAGASGPG